MREISLVKDFRPSVPSRNPGQKSLSRKLVDARFFEPPGMPGRLYPLAPTIGCHIEVALPFAPTRQHGSWQQL